MCLYLMTNSVGDIEKVRGGDLGDLTWIHSYYILFYIFHIS